MKHNKTLSASLLFVLLCALLLALPMTAQGESIDFANGNIDFLALYAKPVDASPDTVMELVDFGEGKAVKVTPAGDAAPYVVIDASSLLGEKVADLVSMEVMVATEHPSGEFYAASGEIIAYSGADRKESKSPWSVYIDFKNPNAAKVTLDTDEKRFVPDAFNFFILNKKDDNGLRATGEPTVLYILSIEFFDGDGNALPVDADAAFNAPDDFESTGATILYTLANEAVIEGASGSTPGGWGQAVSMEAVKNDGIIDPEWFTPGTVITVAYDSEQPPEVIFQSWTDGAPGSAGWAKVSPRIIENGAAQYFYDDIVASFGTDDFSFLDKFYVGDVGDPLTVMKVSFGQGFPPPFAIGDELVIEGAAGSTNGGWGQAVALDAAKNDGPFDAAWLAPGTVVTVAYESAALPEVILQSWTDGAPDGSGWAKVAPFALGNGIAQYSYEDIVASFGSEEIEPFLDKFYVGDTGEALTVIKVTVGKPLPPLAVVTDEFVIEGAAGSTNGGWGQAVSMEAIKNDGIIDPEWFTPGTVITVLYESEGVPEVIFQSWTDGAPGSAGWAKVSPFTAGAGIAQYGYDDIVASFGGDDFSFLDKFYVGDTGDALTVFKVTVGKAVGALPAGEDGEEANDSEEPIALAVQDKTPGLNLREGPGKWHPSVGLIPRDAELSVYEEDGNWVRVQWGDVTGWCNVNYLTMIEDEVIPLPPLVEVEDPFEIEGATGSTNGGWGQAVSMDTVKGGGSVDAAWFVPGTVITVEYESASVPEIIWQSWTDGNPNGWAKVAPFAGEEGVAQFYYGHIVDAFGTDDFETFFDKFNVGDTGEALTVTKVTVGMAVAPDEIPALAVAEEVAADEEDEEEPIELLPLVEVADAFVIEGAEGSSAGGWGQAVTMDAAKNGGPVDAAWFTADIVITVEYESAKVPEVIFQSWTDGNPVGWAKVAPFAGEEGIAQFSYEDIVASFGTDDFETFLDKFYVGDTGEALVVTKVTVGTAQ